MINCAALVIKQKSCSAHVTFQIVWNSMASVQVFFGFFLATIIDFAKSIFAGPLSVIRFCHPDILVAQYQWLLFSLLLCSFLEMLVRRVVRSSSVGHWKRKKNNLIIWSKEPWSQLSLAAPCSSTAQGNWLQFLFGLQNFIQSDGGKKRNRIQQRLITEKYWCALFLFYYFWWGGLGTIEWRYTNLNFFEYYCF